MENIIKLTLSNGMNVEIDTTKANGHALMKARTAANNGDSTVIFLISEIATFDGNKLPAPEILNFSAYDVIADNYPKYVLSLDDFDFSRDGILHENIRQFLLREDW